jgi:hypothetical protein
MHPDLVTLFAYTNEALRLLAQLDAIMERDHMRPEPAQLQQARRVFGRLPNTVLNLRQSLRTRRTLISPVATHPPTQMPADLDDSPPSPQ